MAFVATPNKTIQTALLAWQDIVAGAIVLGVAFDLSAKIAASFGIRIARRSGSAFTAGSPNIRIEFSEKASGNDAWVPGFVFQPIAGASIGNTTFNGAVSAAASTFNVHSATNIAA